MEPTKAAKVVSRARRLDLATAARVLWTVVKLLVALFQGVAALWRSLTGPPAQRIPPAPVAGATREPSL